MFAQDFVSVMQNKWEDIRIPHPPLYLILTAFFSSFIDNQLIAFRLAGGLSFISTLWLIPIVCNTLYPANTSRTSLISIFIWGIHPLALQGSLLIDIDNTIFVPALLIFIVSTSQNHINKWFVAFAFCLLMWCKLLPTTVFIVFSVVLIRLLKKNQVATLIKGLLIGFALFLLTFGLFIIATGFPTHVLSATFQRVAQANQSIDTLIARTMMGGGITAIWIGIPFIFIFLGALKKRIVSFYNKPVILQSDVLILCSIIGVTLLTLGNELPMGFPRYHYPSFLCIVIVASAYLADCRLTSYEGKILILLTGLSAAYFFFVSSDPLLPQYKLTFETNDLNQRLIFGISQQLISLVIPFTVLAVFMRLVKIKNIFLLASLSFCFASWLCLNYAQAKANYSTIYEYGRIGAEQTSLVVQEYTKQGDLIVAPREIEWLTQRQTEFVVSLVGPQTTTDNWLKFFIEKKPTAYVLSQKELSRYKHITEDSEITQFLEMCYTYLPNIGSYHIWLRHCKL